MTGATNFIFPTGVSQAQKDDISFYDGLNADGSLASTTFFAWNTGTIPATYASSNGIASKWAATPASTSAGTAGAVTYYFDTTSNWTAAEEKTFLAAMAIYSDIGNITFTQASSEAAAQTVFYRYSAGKTTKDGDPLQTGYYENASTTRANNADQYTLATRTSSYISAQTSDVANFGDITSYSVSNGYGISTIVHEMGHLVGLGHTGPYNGEVNATTQQYNAADVRTFSIMSYINPDAAAKYASSYAVTGTSWNGAAPFTPMLDDILAVQQLYGAASGRTLNTAQTFGFNTTIAANDAIRMFYDFTVDATPVLTIYDTAAGNKLDLSGYSADSTVNLNPGTFSSIAGLINNISIAYNTAVDYLIGGSGNDRIVVNNDSDVIDGGAGTNTVQFSSALSAYALARTATGYTVTNTASNTVYTLSNVQTLQFSDQAVATSSIACYVRGTRILTTRGEVAVEALEVGDVGVTASGGLRPIRWLGWRALSPARHPAPEKVWPVRVARGAFGDNAPRRDLWLSPDHAVAVDGVLIPVARLVNGRSVAQVRTRNVEYWHVELDAHDVILAEGLAAESYLDTGNRNSFVNAGAFLAAHPDFSARHWSDTCLPMAFDGPAVVAARARLLARLGEAVVTQDAEAHVWLDGRRIAPVEASPTRLVFALPPGGRRIELRSRVFIPAHTRADSSDTRALGLCVRALRIDGEAISLAGEALAGWERPEYEAGAFQRRWTTGATPLPAGAREVIVDLGGLGHYWAEPEVEAVSA